MNTNRISIGGLNMSIDAACLFLVGKLALLALIFPGRIPHSGTIAASLFAVGALFLAGSQFTRRMPEGFLSTVVRTAKVIGLFSFLDRAMKDFQLLLVPGWMDNVLLSLERSVFGTELSVLMQRLISPFLTEGLMFSYVAYVPLLPLVALICYWSEGSRAAHNYLLNLSVTFAVCFLGFMVFPLASPTFHNPGAFTIPLNGGIFTSCVNWIHANHHYPGGSLPSPHCAGTTIMLVTLYRYNRQAFYVLLPTFLSVYIATVYGRFHYVWDGIIGILVAMVVVKSTPRITRWIESMRSRSNHLSVEASRTLTAV